MKHTDTSVASIQSWLKRNIDAPRYRHTMGTYAVAMKLAKRHGANERKTALAALLHDAGRMFFSPKAMIAYIREHGEALPAHRELSTGLLHAAASAAIARAVFGVRDRTVLDAIRRHTTGGKNMSLIAKIIYIADVLDPSRGLPHTRGLLKKAMRDLNDALIDTVRISIDYVMRQRIFLAPGSLEFYNSLIRSRR
ncbi:MAG: bis(5'-nucleosyl)-tetraphosphatase (symmetrical) YqeK [Spirochaetota bacterium]